MAAIIHAILRVTRVLAYLLITALVVAEDALFHRVRPPWKTAASSSGSWPANTT